MSTTTATRRVIKSRAQLRAERAGLDMTLVTSLVDRLFTAWQRHDARRVAIMVRAEYRDDTVLLEWVNYYLDQRIAQVAPHCMGRVDGTKNYLLED